jgi:hypothetical protein
VHNGGNVEKSMLFEIYTMEWLESQQLSLNSDPEKLNRFEVLWIKRGARILWVEERLRKQVYRDWLEFNRKQA